MSLVSDIKLIRTDTTLDLSQKAEKGMPLPSSPSLYILTCSLPMTTPRIWDNQVCTQKRKETPTLTALLPSCALQP
jgi:hypothetical protein